MALLPLDKTGFIQSRLFSKMGGAAFWIWTNRRRQEGPR
jgi:hypothetical protein